MEMDSDPHWSPLRISGLSTVSTGEGTGVAKGGHRASTVDMGELEGNSRFLDLPGKGRELNGCSGSSLYFVTMAEALARIWMDERTDDSREIKGTDIGSLCEIL